MKNNIAALNLYFIRREFKQQDKKIPKKSHTGFA